MRRTDVEERLLRKIFFMLLKIINLSYLQNDLLYLVNKGWKKFQR
jgi:hypothetical protein